jgi:hypothetical protein
MRFVAISNRLPFTVSITEGMPRGKKQSPALLPAIEQNKPHTTGQAT